MTDPTPNPPLWKVMHNAYHAAIKARIREGFISWSPQVGHAAELRAIAKWIEQCAASSHTVSSEDMPTVWRIVGMLQVEAAQAEAEAGE